MDTQLPPPADQNQNPLFIFGVMEPSFLPPQDEQLEKALNVLTSDLCLCISPSFSKLCKSYSFEEDSKKECNRQDPHTPATWWCDNARVFTLIKGSERTLIFSHSDEVLYYASQHLQLAQACPADTAFLCQFTEDITEIRETSGETSEQTPKLLTPKLLAFDILTDDLPAKRGDTLRALSIHLPRPLCEVQWVGPKQFLHKDFLKSLPHPAHSVFCLGPNPLVLGSLM